MRLQMIHIRGQTGPDWSGMVWRRLDRLPRHSTFVIVFNDTYCGWCWGRWCTFSCHYWRLLKIATKLLQRHCCIQSACSAARCVQQRPPCSSPALDTLRPAVLVVVATDHSRSFGPRLLIMSFHRVVVVGENLKKIKETKPTFVAAYAIKSELP